MWQSSFFKWGSQLIKASLYEFECDKFHNESRRNEMDHAGAHFLIISLPLIRMEFRKFGFFITKEVKKEGSHLLLLFHMQIFKKE